MRLRFACVIVFFGVLAGCGGGGGGNITPPRSSPAPSPTASPSPTPTPTPTPTPAYAVTGTAAELISAAPIAGALVTIGAQAASSCTGWDQCGIPVSPAYTATTASDGSFSIGNVPNGTYFVTVAVDANPAQTQTYAILHRTITVDSAPLALGTVKLAKLSSDESAWLVQLNEDRATQALPATKAVVVDEYAEELSRQWAADVSNGTIQFGGPGLGSYLTQYTAEPGAVYSGAGANYFANATAADWRGAESDWWSAKSSCPGGDWRTCVSNTSTLTYISLAEDNAVWVGVAESMTVIPSGQPQAGTYPYDAIVIDYGTTARTASISTQRVAGRVH